MVDDGTDADDGSDDADGVMGLQGDGGHVQAAHGAEGLE